MPHAYVHLPATAHYRREAFVNGFARLGFIVHMEQPTKTMAAQDAAIVWNMTGRSHQTLDHSGQGALMVAENGYCGADRAGHQFYAIALDGHNGSGRWHAPDDSRLRALNLDFKPFYARDHGRVLVADQRGIGSRLMRSPAGFADQTAFEIATQIGADVRIRRHPGRHAPERTLAEDLEWAETLVVWSSNCATRALREGIQTFFKAPAIVTAGAAQPYNPTCLGEFTEEARWDAYARMAWAQWSLDEINSGEALKILLEVHAGRLSAVGRTA